MKIEVKISDAEYRDVQAVAQLIVDQLEYAIDARFHRISGEPRTRTITIHATKGNDDDTLPDS